MNVRILGWKQLKIHMRINYQLGGLFIISSIIFFRFLRPRAFGPIDLTFTPIKCLIYIFLIFCFTLTLLFLIFLPIYYKYINNMAKDTTIFIKNKNTLFLRAQLKIYEFFGKINVIYNTMLDEFFLKYIYENQYISTELFENLVNFANKIKHFYFYFYIFYCLPPCIISFTYLIEVIIYQNFTYFPFSIFLMLFPLTIRAILYSIQFYSRKLKDDSDIYIKYISIEDKSYTFREDSPIPLEEQTQNLLQFIINRRETSLQNIKMFNLYRDILYFDTYKIYFHYFSVLCWLTSFSTLLFLILNN